MRGAFKPDTKPNTVFSLVRLLTTSSHLTDEIVNFRDKLINYHMPADQVYRLKTPQINHAYLTNINNFYANKFQELIEQFACNNPISVDPPAYQDALYHLNHIKSNQFDQISTNSEFLMKSLHDYIFLTDSEQPLVLTGPSGCGKTSYVSTLASNMHLHFIANSGQLGDSALVIRFIGIDGKSIYLRNLLRSLCQQLELIRNEKSVKIENSTQVQVDEADLVQLKSRFKACLTQDMTTPESRLVVILDGLENICPEDNAFKLDWLPKTLGLRCKLIVTVSVEAVDLLARLRRKWANETSFLDVNEIEINQSEQLIDRELRVNGKRLESSQIGLVRGLFERCPVYPLHFRMVAAEFLSWKSTTRLDECVLKDSLEGCVDFFLSGLEKRFDTNLVRHVLGYITITKNGISELELQDILSLDNNLLVTYQSKKQFHQPDNILRMPSFYVLQLLASLKPHLLIRPFHGVYTLFWRHKVFQKIVTRKYLDPDPQLVIYLHRNVAEYFLGSWSSSKQKPISYLITQVQSHDDPGDSARLTFDDPIVKSLCLKLDRLVPDQPIKYTDFHTHIKPRFNLRKLDVLPFHMLNADLIEGKKEVSFKI